MTWPAVVALILMFLAMLPRSPYFLLYLFFGLAPFGSLSMLGSHTGGLVLRDDVRWGGIEPCFPPALF
jgi:hypothetical protein